MNTFLACINIAQTFGKKKKTVSLSTDKYMLINFCRNNLAPICGNMIKQYNILEIEN